MGSRLPHFHKDNNMSISELLKIREAAKVTGFGVSTIRKYEAMGLFPKHIKINGARRWRRQDVEDWIAAGCPRVGNK